MTARHGSTPAAWTGVLLALAGFLTGGIGLIMGNWVVFWVGAGLVVASVIVAKLMQMAGLGAG
jgi:hypothetical protein